MRVDGVVDRCAVIYFRVENMSVNGNVTKASVAVVMS